jgi:hypothetical protein
MGKDNSRRKKRFPTGCGILMLLPVLYYGVQALMRTAPMSGLRHAPENTLRRRTRSSSMSR